MNYGGIGMSKEERFTYFNTWGWQTDAFLEVMNGLDEKNKKLQEQLKQQEKIISEQAIQLDSLKDENLHMKEVLDENEQLKERIRYLKETIIKIAIAYQRKHDNKIGNLVGEVVDLE